MQIQMKQTAIDRRVASKLTSKNDSFTLPDAAKGGSNSTPKRLPPEVRMSAARFPTTAIRYGRN
jgi:hypothetical protein